VGGAGIAMSYGYLHQDEVRRLIENWARWPGWNGCRCSSSPLARLVDDLSFKRRGELGATMPILGGEAADTHAALWSMVTHLRDALIAYYTGGLREEDQLRLVNKNRKRIRQIRARTYRLHVQRAHPAFMDAYELVVEKAKGIGKRNAMLHESLHQNAPQSQ
jgi:hypothetical protein